MSDRDQFEARAAEKLRLPVEVIQSARNGESYLHAFDSMNVMQPLNGWWDWWQASREALKAEQGEDSELLARAKKLEQEVGDIADRLKQPEDDGFMFIPAAYLYAIWTPGSKAPSYTTDASSAFDCAKEGWPVDEYVKLERLQDAMNHPIDTTPNQYDALGKGGEK